MLIPKPNSGETKDAFIKRCMLVIAGEYQNMEQALSVCNAAWRKSKYGVNGDLLKAIKERSQKKAEFGYGILTGDVYVRTLLEGAGLDACYRAGSKGSTSFNDALQKAAETLVYCNEDMVAEESRYRKDVKDTSLSGVELPPNTLMVFRHILTTPRKDRDGDILRTQGAVVDPKMLLLWQHVHTLPIGKMLVVSDHNEDRLQLVSCIVDMNGLCHDAAVMVDNDMGRFSHGFRALEFETIKADNGDGFDIKEFEIMEESLVSVPSNVDADTEEVILSLVEGGKLTSPLMKEYGKSLRSRANVQANVPLDLKDEETEDEDISGGGEDSAEGQGSEQGTTSTSEETKTGTEETTTTSDTEVKIAGPLEGSWEDVTRKLFPKVKSYLAVAGVRGIDEEDWVSIIATFSDYVVVCIEKPECGVTDEFRYWRVDWTMVDGEPGFTGEPLPVDIVTTTEMRERSTLFPLKNPTTEISEEEVKVTVEDAMAIVIARADQDQWNRLMNINDVNSRNKKQQKRIEAYKSLVGR